MLFDTLEHYLALLDIKPTITAEELNRSELSALIIERAETNSWYYWNVYTNIGQPIGVLEFNQLTGKMAREFGSVIAWILKYKMQVKQKIVMRDFLIWFLK